jgi:hypothetical protein
MTDVSSSPLHRANVMMEVLPDGSALLYDPQTDQGHALAALAALVWDMSDGTLTVEGMIAELTATLPRIPDLDQIVQALVDHFTQAGLLEGADGHAC